MVPNETWGWIVIIAYFGALAILMAIGLTTLFFVHRLVQALDLFLHPNAKRVTYTLEKVRGPESVANEARSGSKK